jgi:Ni/Co efflux regulator RcnB
MKALLMAAAVSALVAGAGGVANAQSDYRGHNDRQGYNEHRGWAQDQGADHQWSRGERMGYNDWNHASRIDYRRHHLRHPPRGYEWRESNGQYVLGAIATGVIASMIVNGGR